ncbi:oxidoreductase short-chain dehydrogenase reductase family protein [Rutstroemia sp. NJR-2017a BVV2]|nr:oxidoreductase short-chain dehydrogenase reductase family protein [Rutstroemia sp. NJR-2017a BVV2]
MLYLRGNYSSSSYLTSYQAIPETMGAIRLEGGVAVITRIGKETAFTFAEAGVSSIVFGDISEANIAAAAEGSKKYATDAKYQALAITLDVTNVESVRSLVNTTVESFGRIDYLVNSAGIDVNAYVPYNDSSVTTYDKVMNANARGTYLVSRAVCKGRERNLGGGSIVNVGSALSFGAVPYKVGYVASKHALLGITKASGRFNQFSVLPTSVDPILNPTIAVENGPLGIRINLVCPSCAATYKLSADVTSSRPRSSSQPRTTPGPRIALIELTGPLGIRINLVCPSPMLTEECRRAPPTTDFIKGAVPAGRAAETGEVAESISYLCSSAATYVNGVGLLIDAGLTLTLHLG